MASHRWSPYQAISKMKNSNKNTNPNNTITALIKAQIPKDQLVKIKGGIVGVDDLIDI